MGRSPGQLATAAVWLIRELERRGRDPHQGRIWITPQEMGQLSDFLRYPPLFYLVETDELGRPARICGLRIVVLGVLESEARRQSGA